VGTGVRLSPHALVFLLGCLLLSAAWLALRATPPLASPSPTQLASARPAPRPRVERKTIELAANILRRYVGSYRLDSGVDVAIELDGGRLFAEAAGTRYELRATAETAFYVPELDTDLSFALDGAGNAASFAADLPTGPIAAKRVR
jgi:hypothetical protein